MALRKLRDDLEQFTAARPRLQGSVEGCVAAPSPARMLQQRLEYQARTAAQVNPDKWSTRRSLALIVASSCTLWLAILTAAAQTFQAIA